jgi:hypothetical protein
MQIFSSIIAGLGLIAMLPTYFLLPVLIGTVIYGLIKKDYHYFKLYLKIWGYSILCFILLLATNAVVVVLFG